MRICCNDMYLLRLSRKLSELTDIEHLDGHLAHRRISKSITVNSSFPFLVFKTEFTTLHTCFQCLYTVLSEKGSPVFLVTRDQNLSVSYGIFSSFTMSPQYGRPPSVVHVPYRRPFPSTTTETHATIEFHHLPESIRMFKNCQ